MNCSPGKRGELARSLMIKRNLPLRLPLVQPFALGFIVLCATIFLGATPGFAGSDDVASPSPDPLGTLPSKQVNKNGAVSPKGGEAKLLPQNGTTGPPPSPSPFPGQIYEVPPPSEQALSHPFPDGLPSQPSDNAPDASALPFQGGSPVGPEAPVNSQPVAAPASEVSGNPSVPPTNFPSESLIPDFNQALPQVSSIASPGEPPAPQSQPVSLSPAALSERLTRLEQNVFGSTFAEHDVTARLEHLESETFGTTGSGTPEERLAKLESKIGIQPAFGTAASTTPAPAGPPSSGGALCGDNEVSTIVQAIPSDEKAGDYFANIRPTNGRFARWSKFPIHLHLPQASPEAWEKNLAAGVKKWNQCVPLTVVSSAESADIDVTWVNHLTPRLLGITRIVIAQGNMHVQIFMLRPTYYLPEVPERALLPAFLHELGHAVGLLGHSDDQADVMYPMEFTSGSKFPSRATSVGARDINTLKKVYNSPGIESDYTAPAPIEWGSVTD